MIEAGRLLTKDEITQLNKDGYSLDNSKFYALYFLFNDKLNNAGDPIPFKIATKSLQKIGNTLQGRPLVWTPDPKKHIRANTGGPVEMEANAILNLQRKHSIGEMVGAAMVAPSNNVYGVYEIWPEFISAVQQKLVPPYTSVMLKVNNDNWINDGVIDAEGIHLQYVNKPGYPPELAKLHGTCIGGITKCMAELRILGSAGKLKEWQKSFSNTTHTQGNISMTDKPIEERVAELEGTITSVKNSVATMSGTVTEISNNVAKIVAAAGPGQHVVDVQIKNPPTQNEPAKNPELDEIKNKLKSAEDALAVEKTAREAREKEILNEKRNQVIKDIVSAELKLKEIPLSDESKQIKYYTDLTGEEGTIGSLSLLARKLTSRADKIIGSAGPNEVAIFEFDSPVKTNYLKVFTEAASL